MEVLSCPEMLSKYHKVKDWHLSGFSNSGCAAYCRVSTGHEEQQNSLKKQIEFYTEYIQRDPHWRFVAVYYGTASGLRMDHRPGYQ